MADKKLFFGEIEKQAKASKRSKDQAPKTTYGKKETSVPAKVRGYDDKTKA
jgi:hypothetical protein